MIVDGMRVLGKGMGVIKKEMLERIEEMIVEKKEEVEEPIKVKSAIIIPTGLRSVSPAAPLVPKMMLGKDKGVEVRKEWLAEGMGGYEERGVYGDRGSDDKLLKEAVE
ncbi:hypothetical protein L873DRAFT_957959 [Choiromyces venosus 120613-1]|uniref:Uncharacterized protein n=1 Tax=Choiromyces venosus 120613-1 TaxID=1336337 RepID=A0A3N4K7A2_9PEZI|nr:hypothetical protein L873DRAFT_957959 [Choiromyces venosus 120613-1]